MGCIFISSLQKRHCFSQDLQNKRYGMVSQKCGSQKVLARSRHLGSICDRSLEVWLSGDFAFRVLNFGTTKSRIYHTVPMEEQTQTQGSKKGKTCLMWKVPLLLHMIVTHSMPPSSLVSLAFLYSDVVFPPSLT